jgi:DNA-directed RNA polymerase specialized sigma24 family protein
MLGDRVDAEDATQTTLLNANLALRRGERPRTPGHRLIAIAGNTCRARFRYGLDELKWPSSSRGRAEPSPSVTREAGQAQYGHCRLPG